MTAFFVWVCCSKLVVVRVNARARACSGASLHFLANPPTFGESTSIRLLFWMWRITCSTARACYCSHWNKAFLFFPFLILILVAQVLIRFIFQLRCEWHSDQKKLKQHKNQKRKQKKHRGRKQGQEPATLRPVFTCSDKSAFLSIELVPQTSRLKLTSFGMSWLGLQTPSFCSSSYGIYLCCLFFWLQRKFRNTYQHRKSFFLQVLPLLCFQGHPRQSRSHLMLLWLVDVACILTKCAVFHSAGSSFRVTADGLHHVTCNCTLRIIVLATPMLLNSTGCCCRAIPGSVSCYYYCGLWILCGTTFEQHRQPPLGKEVLRHSSQLDKLGKPFSQTWFCTKLIMTFHSLCIFSDSCHRPQEDISGGASTKMVWLRVSFSFLTHAVNWKQNCFVKDVSANFFSCTSSGPPEAVRSPKWKWPIGQLVALQAVRKKGHRRTTCSVHAAFSEPFFQSHTDQPNSACASFQDVHPHRLVWRSWSVGRKAIV